MEKIHIHQLLNEFNSQYGKKHKKIEVTIHHHHIFLKVYYGENEVIMIKLWLQIEDEHFELKPPYKTYKLILYKDNIYTNQYCMPDTENQKHFITTYEKFVGNKVDIVIGSWEIKDFDGKLLHDCYIENQKQIKKHADSLIQHNYFKQYKIIKECPSKYEDAINNLPFHIDVETYLTNLINQNLVKIKDIQAWLT